VNVGSLPGVITGDHLAPVIAKIETLLGVTARSEKPQVATIEAPAALRPTKVGSLDGYDIVEYEGWFYGLPHALGAINLQEVDVLEMPGVLRDLSREVVEGEIRELALSSASRAA
jgi:hypothetical protein